MTLIETAPPHGVSRVEVTEGSEMGRDLGPILVAVGLLVVLVGVLAWSGGLSWFGRLPGDIRVERDDVRIYIPWVSMLAVSVVVSIVMSLFRR